MLIEIHATCRVRHSVAITSLRVGPLYEAPLCVACIPSSVCLSVVRLFRPKALESPKSELTVHSHPFFRHHQNPWSHTGPKLDLKQACFLTIRSIHFYIRALRHIRPALTESMAASLGASLAQSRLDYANSIMYGMSASNMHKLHSLQNYLIRVVLPSLRHLSASERLSYLH